MSIFRFYPSDFVRMYVAGESKEEVLSRADELFEEYFANQYDYFDEDDIEEKNEIREKFMKGILELIESENGTFVDSNY